MEGGGWGEEFRNARAFRRAERGDYVRFRFLAPRVGFEPTTNELTAHCSTAELPRNVAQLYGVAGRLVNRFESIILHAGAAQGLLNGRAHDQTKAQ